MTHAWTFGLGQGSGIFVDVSNRTLIRTQSLRLAQCVEMGTRANDILMIEATKDDGHTGQLGVSFEHASAAWRYRAPSYEKREKKKVAARLECTAPARALAFPPGSSNISGSPCNRERAARTNGASRSWRPREQIFFLSLMHLPTISVAYYRVALIDRVTIDPPGPFDFTWPENDAAASSPTLSSISQFADSRLSKHLIFYN